jgi:hypothetical protein
MYHACWNEDKWSRWTNLGGLCMTAPKAVSQLPERLDVFHTGEEGEIYHKYFTGENGWIPSIQDWERLGGRATGRLG